jgi:serine/threonine-protein kinase
MSASDSLLLIAGALAEGESVDWSDDARVAEASGESAAVDALKDLETLLIALRRIREDDEDPSTVPPSGETGAPQPERLAAGTWRHLTLLNVIGHGGFGTVYRAHDARLGVDVALKLLAPSDSARRHQADRILNEARLLARVRHPNIVRVYGVDDTGDRAGLWMEFIDGRTLAQLLRDRGSFGPHEAALIGRDLCRAMAAVHHAGVLHGDIKAHNVMRESGGRIVLMDFGAGETLAADDASRPVRMAGTPRYLAPEVLDGRPRSVSSDVYALGVLLFHLVTDAYPVSGDRLEDMISAHRRRERRRLRDVRPDLPDGFVRAVEQATASDPAKRFSSFGALEDALVAVTLPEPFLQDAQDRMPGGTPRHLRRWGWAIALGLALVAAAATLPRLAPFGRRVASDSAARTLAEPAAAADTAQSDATYEIEAGFYRVRPGTEERLEPDSRLTPGDELYLTLRTSAPIYAYVVDEDELGEAFLLFPLPGQQPTNPLPAGLPVVVPGSTRWQVTSAGGREHFLIFASPQPVDSLDQALARLPVPKEGTAVSSEALPAATLERLRGVGGLTAASPEQRSDAVLSRLFTSPLTSVPERVRGLWVRQLTLANPAK